VDADEYAEAMCERLAHLRGAWSEHLSVESLGWSADGRDRRIAFVVRAQIRRLRLSDSLLFDSDTGEWMDAADLGLDTVDAEAFDLEERLMTVFRYSYRTRQVLVDADFRVEFLDD
jgi:hypothetical protein